MSDQESKNMYHLFKKCFSIFLLKYAKQEEFFQVYVCWPLVGLCMCNSRKSSLGKCNPNLLGNKTAIDW